MNCFQLIKTVLDEAYAAIPGDERSKDAAIAAALDGLSGQYKELWKAGCLDYSDPARRFAYIYRYTTCHANLVNSVIARDGSMEALFERDRLNVACIGGGPGSDFLGILKCCMTNGHNPHLKCQLLDRDPAWGESWSDVDDKLSTTFRISTGFQPFDVTSPSSWKSFTKHFHADLITMIFFMSEVYAEREKANEYFLALLGGARPGARLLFIDNNAPIFFKWFDDFAAKCGWRTDIAGHGTMKMPWDEEKSDLDPYYSKFQNPRIQADIAFRTATKT